MLKDPEVTRVLNESRTLAEARQSIPPKQVGDMSPWQMFDEGGLYPVKW